jgi:hypothetical protein
MKIKTLRGLMNQNLKVCIHDPEDTAPWVGKGREIPHKYLNRKVFALNPSHIPSEYSKEYEDCLDVWIDAEDKGKDKENETDN